MDEEVDGLAKLARRDALQALLDNRYRGNRKRLYIAAGLTHGRLCQMLTDGFDENLARDLEGQLGLPYRFFEVPPTVHAIDLTPRACLIGALLDKLVHDEARHKATFGLQYVSRLHSLLYEFKAFLDVYARVVVRLVSTQTGPNGFNSGKFDGVELAGGGLLNWLARQQLQTFPRRPVRAVHFWHASIYAHVHASHLRR